MHAPAPIRAVLFDLGGVLLDIDFDRALQAWAPHSRLPIGELRARFGFDEGAAGGAGGRPCGCARGAQRTRAAGSGKPWIPACAGMTKQFPPARG
jgi:hypothetical protein